MLTDVQQINLGLSKLASSRVTRIDPATTPLEKYMAINYPAWKRTELAKRRWVFATEDNHQLTQSEILENAPYKYKYHLPIDCLRVVRGKNTTWVQRGRYIMSNDATQRITYIRNAPESEWDPLFNDVMAAKIAKESAEYVTQSSSKRQLAMSDYDEAIREAAKANAFTIGSETIDSDYDVGYTWLEPHHG